MKESVVNGDHTPVVKLGLRYGMILFIASEVMFFVAWFWAYFNAALFPTDVNLRGLAAGEHRDVRSLAPAADEHADPADLGHDRDLGAPRDPNRRPHGAVNGLALTDLARHAASPPSRPMSTPTRRFAFAGNIYGATFFMATGFHGFHVIVGTIFLIVCFFRARAGHFTPERHFGFEAAAWYWHFVDVVWLFLFASIYVWGEGAHLAVH